MWGESSQNCENNCQCSGLITDSFRINSGNSATKRKQAEATSTNFKSKMHPHTLDFKTPLSPLLSPRATPSKRRVLGEIQNSLDSPYSKFSSETKVSLSSLFRPKLSPVDKLKCQSVAGDNSSPVSSRKLVKRTTSKISRIFEERSRFKMSSNKENVSMERETFMKLDFEQSSLDIQGSSLDFQESCLDLEESRIDTFESRLETQGLESLDAGESRNEEDLEESLHLLEDKEERIDLNLEEETRPFGFQTTSLTNWSTTKLDFTNALHLKSSKMETTKMENQDFCVPQKDYDLEDTDFETLHDLEEEFENDNFDLCTKYEIISTDSPNIISRGRTSSSRKISSSNFVFGAPIAKEEQSTSFNKKPNVNATRTLNFENESENFDFTSPASKKRPESYSVKKSLKFTEVPVKNFRPFGEGCSNENSPNAIKMLKLSDTPTKTFTKFPKFGDTPTKISCTPTKSFKIGATPTKNVKIGFTPTKTVLNPLRHEKSDSSIGSMVSPTSSLGSSITSTRFRLFTSESTTSMESGFISEMEEPFLELEEHSNSPKMANFNELLSGPIKDDIFSTSTKTFLKRPLLQRSLSFNPEATKLKVKQSLFTENVDPKKSQKRQDPLVLEVANKKMKQDENKRPVLQRAFSENHATIIKNALSRSCTEPDLIADFSVPYALPLTVGQHSDLKAISCETLADLLKGHYDDTVGEYQVIDCRYPYEFEGGHIKAAKNMYTPDQVKDLLTSSTDRGRKRHILVFHCEFSLERGPKLYRYLRSMDRSKNAENYPSLNYPEIYLLHEGYRTFYNSYPSLCTPMGYTPMLSPSHSHLLRKHRSGDQPASFYTHHRKNQ